MRDRDISLWEDIVQCLVCQGSLHCIVHFYLPILRELISYVS